MISHKRRSIAPWIRLRDRIQHEGLNSYETLLPFPFPLKVWSGGETPRHLLYFTKDLLCMRWWEEGLFPGDWMVIVRHGIPTPESLDAIRHLGEGFGLPLGFVGDLDPLDLTVFLTLRYGDPDLKSMTTRALPITYCGIDDAWLALARKHLTNADEQLSIRMGRLEARHFSVLDKIEPGLRTLIGSNSYKLLGTGRKIEMEAAGGRFYRKPFLKHLKAHLERSLAQKRAASKGD